MKKLILLILAITMVISLASCKIFSDGKEPDSGEQGGDNGDGGTSQSDGVIFSSSVSVQLVKPKGSSIDLTKVSEAIHAMTGKLAPVNTDAGPKDGNEIVFGDTNRPETEKAKKKLDAALASAIRRAEDEGLDTTFIEGYAVYAEGGTVAVVWSNNNARESVINLFIKNYVSAETLKLDDGYFYTETFDLLKYMEEAEEVERREHLAKIEAQYDKDVAKAVENLWSIYDDRYVLWLADLYDPGEYDEDGNPLGGGFYYSNSARDNAGYDIDLESTEQILSFLVGTGMLPSYDAVYQDYIPEKMQKELVAFAYSCQSPIDGGFYHPQWGMNVSESRKSRDEGWGIDILNHFGYKPKWNTPGGAKGTEGDPPGAVASASLLTGRLSDSSPKSVSLIPVADTWTGSSMFVDLNAWIKYLESLESSIRTKSYSIGNTVSGFADQAKRREKLAIERGELKDANLDGRAEGGYLDKFAEYFNKWQLPENGLWEHGKVEDGTITYASVNGLMKTIGAYNGFQAALPYAEKALASAVFMVTFMGDENGRDVAGDAASSSVDVFNPWVCIDLVLKNIANYGDANTAANLKAQIQQNAANMINATREKIAKFKKEDGSFGYTWTVSPSTSQGSPVSVPYTVEGDVNGGGIAVNGTTRYIRRVMGFDMPIYYFSDYLRFINRIEQLEPVIKEEGVTIPASVIDFDSDSTVPSEIQDNMKTGSLEVVRDTREDATGNVLKFYTHTGVNSSFSLNPGKVSASYSLVLEFDIKFEEVKYFNGTLFQIKVGNGYMLTCGVNSAGEVTFGDQSATSGSSVVYSSYGVKADAYSWNSVRVEYYVLDAESNTTVTKLFLNGELRGVSNNYMGKGTASTPSMTYNGATFSSLNATDMTVLFDNIYATESDEKFVEEEIVNPERLKDFENAEVGGEMPVGVVADGSSVVLAEKDGNAENKALLMSAKSKSALFSVTVGSAGFNCYSADMMIKIPSSTLGVIGKMGLANGTLSVSVVAYELAVYEDGGTRYASLTEIGKNGERGETYYGIPTDSWQKLRIEFYPNRYLENESSIVYLGDREIGRGGLWYSISTVGKTYTRFILSLAADCEIYIDDVVAEKIFKQFVTTGGEAVADPKVEFPMGGPSSNVDPTPNHDGRFDFESSELGTPAVPGLQTKTNSTEYGNRMDIVLDPKNAANKVISYETLTGSNGVGNSLIVQASKKSPAGANCYVLEFDMLIEDFNSDGHLQIAFKSSYAKNEYTIFSTNTSAKVTSSKTTYAISSKAEKTSWKSIVPSTEIRGWVNVRFEYYKDAGMLKVYYDGDFRGESDQYWNEGNMSMSLTHAVLYTTKVTDSKLYFDNIVCEAIKKDYTSETPISSSTPAGDEYVPSDTPSTPTPPSSGGGTGGGTDDGGDIATPDLSLYTGYTDFNDYQTATFFISGITSSLKSGMTLVYEDPRDPDGRVLYFNTVPQSSDKVHALIKDSPSGKKDKILVEWWMSFEEINAASYYQISIGGTYMLVIETNAKGSYYIAETTSTNSSVAKKQTFKSAINSYSWQKITVQLEIADDGILAKIYLGGMLIGMSESFYNYSGTATSPVKPDGKVNFSATSSANATILLDNITAKYVDSFDEVKIEGDVYTGFTDFEGAEEGSFSTVGIGSTLVNGSAKVIASEREGEVTKVLEAVTKSGGSDKILVDILSSADIPKEKLLVEWWMRFDEMTTSGVYQISVGGTYMFTVNITPSKNTYSLGDTSSTNGSVAKYSSFKTGILGSSWQKITLQLSLADDGIYVKVYVSGMLVGTSENYYNYSGNATAPNEIGNAISFSSTSGCAATLLLDNITAKFVDEFETVKVEGDVYTGFNDFEKYKTEDAQVPGITATLKNGSVSLTDCEREGEVNRVLKYSTASGGSDKVHVDLLKTENGTENKFILEWDILFDPTEAESVYQINCADVYMLTINVYKSGTFSIGETTSTNGACAKTKNFAKGVSYSTWHTVRVEYTGIEGSCSVKIYLDTALIGESSAFYNYDGTKTEPGKMGGAINFSSTQSSVSTMYIDNITAKFIAAE